MSDRYVRMREGRLMLVEELDGYAYVRALRGGRETTWESLTTLETLAARFGAESRLVDEARVLLAQEVARALE